MMDRLQLDNDLASDFERGVELADNSARLERLKARFAPPVAPEDQGEAGGGGGSKGSAKPAAAAGAAPASNEGAKNNVPGPAGARQRMTEADDGTGGDAVKAVLGDILTGARDSAPQIAGGVLDAVNETLQTVEGLDNLIEEKLGLPNLDPTEGLRLPTTDPSDSVTGALIRSTAQFLTGFVPAMKAVKGLSAGSRVLQSLEAGAIADLVVFDPHMERLTTWLNQVPALAPLVPDYLADNNPESEAEWEGRLKNAVEGAGLGLMTDGLLRVFKYYKSARATTAAARQAAMSKADLANVAAADAIRDKAKVDIVQPLQPGALDSLGDVGGGLFVGAPRGETMAQAVAMERDARDLRLIGEALPAGMTPRFTKDGISVIGADRQRVAVLPRPGNVDEAFLGTIGQRIDESGAVERALGAVRQRVEAAAVARGFIPMSDARARGLRTSTKDVQGAVLFRGKVYTGSDHGQAIQAIVKAFGADDAKIFGEIDALPENAFGFVRKGASAEVDPFDEMVNAARAGLGKAPAEEVGRFPAIGLLRSIGGVKPGSPLAQALAAKDVTPRRFPGLFRKTGVGAADNIPAGDTQFRAGDGGYIDPEDLLAAIDEELGGNPRLDVVRQERQLEFEEASRNADEFRRELEALGVDLDTMDNASVRRRLDEVDAERARIRDMEETPRATSEAEFGGLDADEGAAPPAIDGAARPGLAREPKIYINHARINSTDDVKALIQQMADEDADAINVKRRGVVSNAQTLRESADEITKLSDLIGRQPGPMAAAEAVAARKILTASGEQLVTLATKASGAEATAADLFAFRRAMQVHYAIQAEVIAARTETARALQSWAIPAGNSKQRADQIAEMLNRDGGSKDTIEFAGMIATLANNPAGLNIAIRKSLRGKLRDAMFEAWINGLLASPKTHVVNITSNALTTFWSIPERYLAAGISNAFYGGEVSVGEAASSAYGIVQGVRDGIRLVARGQDDQRVADLFDAFVKAGRPIAPAISAEAFDINPAGTIGRAINLMGSAIRSPGALLDMEDKFFKSVNYRMELHRLAYRQASQEGLEGRQLGTRVAEIMNDAPETIRVEAMDAAHVATFTKELGDKGQKLTRLLNSVPTARLVVPFIRTPANILKYTFARTPLAYLSAGIRADIAAGGAKAAQAHARVALGSMVMLTIGGYVADGVVTGQGPADPTMRAAKMRTGWKPYSVKFGDRWYQYNRLEPIGMLFGMGSDIAEIIGHVGEDDAEKLALAGVTAFAQNLASKTWTRGVFELIGALDPNNPVKDLGKYFVDFTGSFIPFSSLLRNVEQVVDPALRETRTTAEDEFAQKYLGDLPEPVAEFLTALINQHRKSIPGLSDELPARPNLWGQPIETDTGLGWVYDFLSPVGGSVATDDPVDKAIVDERIKLSMPERAINDVRLTGEEYAQYVKLAGEPAKKMLDRIVGSAGFAKASGGPDGMKAEIIRDVVAQQREAARAQMLIRNPRLRARWLELERDKRSALTGAAQ